MIVSFLFHIFLIWLYLQYISLVPIPIEIFLFRPLSGMTNWLKNMLWANPLLMGLMIYVHKVLRKKRILWWLAMKKMNGTDYCAWGKELLFGCILFCVIYYFDNFHVLCEWLHCIRKYLFILWNYHFRIHYELWNINAWDAFVLESTLACRWG